MRSKFVFELKHITRLKFHLFMKTGEQCSPLLYVYGIFECRVGVLPPPHYNHFSRIFATTNRAMLVCGSLWEGAVVEDD